MSHLSGYHSMSHISQCRKLDPTAKPNQVLNPKVNQSRHVVWIIELGIALD